MPPPKKDPAELKDVVGSTGEQVEQCGLARTA